MDATKELEEADARDEARVLRVLRCRAGEAFGGAHRACVARSLTLTRAGDSAEPRVPAGAEGAHASRRLAGLDVALTCALTLPLLAAPHARLPAAWLVVLGRHRCDTPGTDTAAQRTRVCVSESHGTG